MVMIAGGIDIPKHNESLGIQLNERMLRKCIQIFNQAYDDRQNDEYVVHSCKHGYKLTRDKAEIKKSIMDNDRRAFTMLKQTRRVRKVLGMKDQVSLFD